MLNFPYMEEAQMAAFLQELDSGRPHTWASYPSFHSISGR